MDNSGKVIELVLPVEKTDEPQGESPAPKRRTRKKTSKVRSEEEEKKRPADLRALGRMMNERDMNPKDVYDSLATYARLMEAEDPEYRDEYLSYSGFVKMLNGDRDPGINMFIKLLGIMNYQMIVAPQEANIKISVDGVEVEIPAGEKVDAIKLYRREKERVTTLDERAAVQVTERIGLVRDYVSLPRKVTLRIRAQRGKRTTDPAQAKEEGGED